MRRRFRRSSLPAPALGVALALLGAAAGAGARADSASEVRVLLGADRWREALQMAESLLDARPGDPEAASALGEALYRAGLLEEAAEVLAALGDGAPARGLVTMALLRSSEGDHEEATRLASLALERGGDDPHVLFWAAGLQPDRAARIRVLDRFLEVAEEGDSDRVEAARGSARLQRALGDRQVWVAEDRPPESEISLRRLPGGDRSAVGFTVSVRLGDRRRSVPLLLDTGSPGLFLDERVARKGGFEPLAEETTFGGGGSGRHRSGRGLLDGFRVGGLAYSDALATSSRTAIDPSLPYRGLVGLTPFEGYRVTLDLSRERLILGPPGTADGESPADARSYWTVNGQLLVRAGAEGGPTGLFLLDTGASRTLLDLEFARSIAGARIGEPSDVRTYGGTRRGARTVENVVLRVAGARTPEGARMNAADLSLRSRLSGVRIAGFLGLDALDGRIVSLDTVAHTYTIEDAAR